MEAVQTTVEKPCFETVWAAIQDLTKAQREHTEQQKETERQMKESATRLDRQLGRFGNRIGEMVESMVEPSLLAEFNALGFMFERVYRDAKVANREKNLFYEVDLTLENGEKVMNVEVKVKPTTEHITEHLERMQKIRARADSHGDKRKHLGAIAGMVFDDNVKAFALKNGFYVIEPSGDIFTVIAPEGIYSPQEW